MGVLELKITFALSFIAIRLRALKYGGGGGRGAVGGLQGRLMGIQTVGNFGLYSGFRFSMELMD